MKPLPHAKYFEGILQLRNADDAILNEIYEQVAREGRAVITREKRISGGVDLYFSNQHYLQSFSQKLRRKYPALVKTNEKLVTVSKRTGKDLYRITVFFKILPFNIGDTIEYQGENYYVQTMGKTVTLKAVKSGIKRHMLVEQLLLRHMRAQQSPSR